MKGVVFALAASAAGCSSVLGAMVYDNHSSDPSAYQAYFSPKNVFGYHAGLGDDITVTDTTNAIESASLLFANLGGTYSSKLYVQIRERGSGPSIGKVLGQGSLDFTVNQLWTTLTVKFDTPVQLTSRDIFVTFYTLDANQDFGIGWGASPTIGSTSLYRYALGFAPWGQSDWTAMDVLTSQAPMGLAIGLNAIPAPSSLGLLGLGAVVVGRRRR
ncbi:MAG: PEP-CTERM sorting domain-containing protein [Planctomycetota bacterium]|nr:PEP-CTERM sorting domain-containing protein [Planctomycetota bacterium]